MTFQFKFPPIFVIISILLIISLPTIFAGVMIGNCSCPNNAPLQPEQPEGGGCDPTCTCAFPCAPPLTPNDMCDSCDGCPPNHDYNQTLSICECVLTNNDCLAGEVADTSVGICECKSCPVGYVYVHGIGCECGMSDSECQRTLGTTFFINESCTCQSCVSTHQCGPNGSSYYDLNTSQCGCTCSNNYTGDFCTTPPAPVDCSDSCNGHTGTMNPATGVCQCDCGTFCTGINEGPNEACQCKCQGSPPTLCTSPQILTPSGCACTNCDITCSQNAIAISDGLSQCSCTCQPGFSGPDCQPIDQCSECPYGYTVNNNICTCNCNDMTCPFGQIPGSPPSCGCMCSPGTCSPGQFKDSSCNCSICLNPCNQYQTLTSNGIDSATCSCQCNIQQSDCTGLQFSTANGNSCICECPTNSTPNGNKCECMPGYYRPSGTTGGPCHPITNCQNGTFNMNTGLCDCYSNETQGFWYAPTIGGPCTECNTSYLSLSCKENMYIGFEMVSIDVHEEENNNNYEYVEIVENNDEFDVLTAQADPWNSSTCLCNPILEPICIHGTFNDTTRQCDCIQNWDGIECELCTIQCQNGLSPTSNCECQKCPNNCPGGYKAGTCECILILTCTTSQFINGQNQCQDCCTGINQILLTPNSDTVNESTCNCGCTGHFYPFPTCTKCDTIALQATCIENPSIIVHTLPPDISTNPPITDLSYVINIDNSTTLTEINTNFDIDEVTCTCIPHVCTDKDIISCEIGQQFDMTQCKCIPKICTKICNNGGTINLSCECQCINGFTGELCLDQIVVPLPKMNATFGLPLELGSNGIPIIKKGIPIPLSWSFTNIILQPTDIISIFILNAGFTVNNNNGNNVNGNINNFIVQNNDDDNNIGYDDNDNESLQYTNDELYTLLSTPFSTTNNNNNNNNNPYTFYLDSILALSTTLPYHITIPTNVQSSQNAQIRIILSTNTTTLTQDSPSFEISSQSPCDDRCTINQQCILTIDNNNNNENNENKTVQAECKCKPGYIHIGNNQCELSCYNKCNEPYGKCIAIKDKLLNIIGSKCLCQQNKDDMNNNNNNIIYSGTTCSIQTNIKCIKDDELLCNNHGTVYNNNLLKCTTTCQCDNNIWYGTNCNSCYIYNESTSIGCSSPGTDSILTMSLCSTIDNKQCICLPGYYGNKCQYRVIYGTLYFHRQESLITSQPINNIDINTTFNINTTTTTTTSTSSQSSQLKQSSQTILFLNQTNLEYITPEGKFVLENDLALSLNIQPQFVLLIGLLEKVLIEKFKYEISAIFLINSNLTMNDINNNNNNNKNINTFNIQQQSSSSTPTPTPTTLNDLYSSWSTLSTNFDNSRIKTTEVSRELGTPQGTSAAYDPECTTTTTTTTDNNDCPIGTTPFSLQTEDEMNEKKTLSIGAIIGIIIGIIIFVILLFIIVICSIQYCKKYEKCCFDKKDSKQRNGNGKSHNNNETEMTVATNTSSIENDNDHNSTIVTKTTTTNTINNNNNNDNDRSTKTAVDLVEITNHGEKLPSGWSKQQHTITGEIFYVNNDKMISQRHSPIDGIGGDNASSQW